MAKRSKVQLYGQIRRAHAAQETKSVRALAREFRVHRRDVRAALESAVLPPRKTPVLTPLTEIPQGCSVEIPHLWWVGL